MSFGMRKTGYGAYGNVMLDDVYVYGRSTSAYRAAARDIWNQGNGRARGGSAGSNGGNAVNGIGVVQYVANDLLNAPYTQAKRVDGRPKPVPVNVLNRAKGIKYSKAVNLTTKIGNILPWVSLGTSVVNGVKYGFQNHNYLDIGVSLVFAIGSMTAFAPVIAIAGILYFGIDIVNQVATGKSITEYVD